MKSESHGINISPVEVLNISPNGIWLFVKDSEYLELLHKHHLFWEDLDVDLDLDSIKHPEKYPLKAV